MTTEGGSTRREYVIALAVIVAASALTWWTTSATWAVAEVSLLGEADGSLGQAVARQSLSASTLAPVAAAMPIVGFAALAGILGSRGTLRRVVGALLLLSGCALVWSALTAASSLRLGAVPPGGTGSIVAISVAWPLLSAAGGCALAAAGLTASIRAARWPTLGSNYERSTSDPKDAWEALDHGIDPTEEQTDR